MLTMDAYDESDSDSFSESSSEDDTFSVITWQGEHILSNLEESIGKIDDFLSFGRVYYHGDIVCAVGDSSRQMGRVVHVNMFVDLENAFGKLLQGVDSRELKRIRSISEGDYVINGPWLGRVDKVVDHIGIIFDDGTKHEILETEPGMLIPVSPSLLDDSLFPYHPGQRVKLGQPPLSKSSGWWCGILKKNHQEGVIYSVEAGSVYVDWLAPALTCANNIVPPPRLILDPNVLTTLSCFLHSNWLLGEWCILPNAGKNVGTSRSTYTYRSNLLKEHENSLCGMIRRDFNANLEDMYVIVNRTMKFDVVWQDGNWSTGLESRDLFPVTAVNASDFFPEEIVLEKTSCDDPGASRNGRWGVVKLVDANEKTVKVEWKTMVGDTNTLDGRLEEMVSAYELVEHPDFTFNHGDVVFFSERNHLLGQPDVSALKEAAMLQIMNRDAGSGVNQFKCYLSKIGNVIGFKDGNVQVRWANGITTQVAPYNLVGMDKDGGLAATFIRHEENAAEPNQELTQVTEQGKQSIWRYETDPLDIINVDGGNSTSSGLQQAIMGFFTGIAPNFLGSRGSTSRGQPLAYADTSDGGELNDNHTNDKPKASEPSNLCMKVAPAVTSDSDEHGSATLEQKDEKPVGSHDLLPLSSDQTMERFKQFDIVGVGDCSDHHFVNGTGGRSSLSQVERGWLKKVQRDWSILQQDLPETIYVRVYEERMDLIRAAIAGASGTPYHDGLFFFDILLPPGYPNEPPLVHYHSGGLCLNPNLYESGRVCLSLLNTWMGSGSEVWNPGSSTILQVLLSLQALVLNEKPYFNEAGYDKQIGRFEGEKNSISYNENAFLVTCKTMLYHLRKPPKHFEGLVEEHFQRRSKHILSACKAYMADTAVGSFVHDNPGAQHKGNSTGFKIMLAKIFPKLAEAFSAIGSDSNPSAP